MSLPSRPSAAGQGPGAPERSSASGVDAARPTARNGDPEIPARGIRRGRLKALLVLLVCAAPVIASYLTYYVIQPTGRTNYGQLVEQQPVADVVGVDLQNAEASLQALQGRWLMVLASENGCSDEACRQRLYLSRQVRTTTGKDMDRVDRVLLLTKDAVPDPELLKQHPGLHLIRVPRQRFDAVFANARPAADVGANVQPGQSMAVDDALYLIDPLGHLMMRYPPDFDANRLKKDLAKLLRASRIG